MIEAVFALAIWGWFLAGIGVYVGMLLPENTENEPALTAALKLFLSWLIWPALLAYRLSRLES